MKKFSENQYKIEILTIDEFSNLIQDKFREYNIKDKIKYFDYNDDLSKVFMSDDFVKYCKFFVAYNNKDIIGILKFGKFYKDYSISYLSVNSDYQNKGIVKDLLKKFLKYFKDNYNNEILNLSGYTVSGWKYLRPEILQLSKKYHIKLKEGYIEYDINWKTDKEIYDKAEEEIEKLYGKKYAY